MQSKLTLSIEQEVIEQAKAYAKQQGVSLSKYVQEFLRKNAKPEREEIEIPENLEKLCGIIDISEDFDFKEERAKHLWEKYNRLG